MREVSVESLLVSGCPQEIISPSEAELNYRIILERMPQKRCARARQSIHTFGSRESLFIGEDRGRGGREDGNGRRRGARGKKDAIDASHVQSPAKAERSLNSPHDLGTFKQDQISFSFLPRRARDAPYPLVFGPLVFVVTYNIFFPPFSLFCSPCSILSFAL